MTALTQGDALNRAIAEARGWRRYRRDGDAWVATDGAGMWHDGRMWAEPRFATDPAWTLRLLEEMAAQGSSIEPTIGRWQDTWRVEFYSGYLRLFSAPTFPEAVARAWLAWHNATAPTEAGAVSDDAGATG